MKSILKFKHWEFFGLIILIIFTFDFLPSSLISPNLSSLISSTVIGIILFLWLWSAANKIHQLLPGTIKMNLMLFRFCLISSYTYALILGVFIFAKHSAGNIPDISEFTYLVPIHFAAILCIMHCYYFIAKGINSVELQTKAVFKDYIADFFFIWFIFIGIWFIQPRINKL